MNFDPNRGLSGIRQLFEFQTDTVKVAFFFCSSTDCFMTQRISFFTYSEWDSDRACMAFIALVDGKRARCLIRPEALVELAQEDAGTPILSFAQSREAVEELAKTLIQKGRLDGAELVIRLSDVQDYRSSLPVPPPPPPSPLPPEAPPARAALFDGRQMSMPDSDRQEVWQSLCDRQRLACNDASSAQASRAKDELEAFESRTVPETAHELNLRRVEATRMVASWKAEMVN